MRNAAYAASRVPGMFIKNIRKGCWRLKLEKKGRLWVVLMLVLALLAGCTGGGGSSSGGGGGTGSSSGAGSSSGGGGGGSGNAAPPGNEPITLKFVRAHWVDVSPSNNEKWIWKKYEEMTNIHVEWEEIPVGNFQERFNILMNTGDYGDAFYGANTVIGVEQMAEYARQGIFIPLDDLIEKHAPNIREMLNKRPEIRQALTMPDGKIYSLPYVQESAADASLRYYINKKWLDNLGLGLPKTLDEFTDMLRAFRDRDANGNGDPNDEVPYYMNIIGFLEQQLYGSFGLGTGGLQSINQWVYKDENGQIQPMWTSEGQRAVWRYLNLLWKEGLLHPQIFESIEYGQWVADAAAGKVGVFSFVTPDYIGSAAADYVGIHVLEGPQGHKIMSWIDNPARSISAFAITNKNPHPERTIQWVDFWYGESGQIMGMFGVEGETFVRDEKGMPVYTDDILNYKDGWQLGAFQKLDHVYGGFYPIWEPDSSLKLNAIGKTPEEYFAAPDIGQIDRYLPPELWPSFSPTEEESKELAALRADIGPYVDEARVKFAKGEWNIDGADWDNYVQTMKRIGYDRWVEIKREQYKRIIGG